MLKIIILLSLLIPIACNPASGGNNDGHVKPNLINGKEVPVSDWPFVVRIKTGNAGCTATVVGPKVVLTAAHCGSNGATSSFSINGKSYRGKVYRSPIYPRQDHDVAAIIVDEVISKDVVGRYVHVGGSNVNGQKKLLMGYGCIRPGGGGGNDGKLRAGFAEITGNSGYDIVSGRPGQAALCFGDSGGPMFEDKDLNMNPDEVKLLAINSKGNIRDKNYNASLVNAESQRYLANVGEKYSVEICGVNGSDETCDIDGPTPPDPKPPQPPVPPVPPGPQECSEETKRDILSVLETCLNL